MSCYYQRLHTHHKLQIFLSLTVALNLIARVRAVIEHYATSRKADDSVPDQLNAFVNLPDPSSRTKRWALLALEQK
jgi:hypothetical protein